ncbi:hypothetical protein BV20DRAFT_702193 [Pilatotrama ljubarskyi]|nr:hypothetical protein BV20DRAFT_702193 [Pilatotrama ljubarskyi]
MAVDRHTATNTFSRHHIGVWLACEAYKQACFVATQWDSTPLSLAGRGVRASPLRGGVSRHSPSDRQTSHQCLLRPAASQPQPTGGHPLCSRLSSRKAKSRWSRCLHPSRLSCKRWSLLEAEDGEWTQPGPLTVEWVTSLGPEDAHYENGQILDEEAFAKTIEVLFVAKKAVVEEETRT